MTLTQFYTATTLDGFIADPNHSLDWLLTRDHDADGPGGYRDFIKGVGAIAMGANTYEWILRRIQSGEDEGLAYEVPAWVFTHRDLPPIPGADIRVTSATVRAVHSEMRAAAGDRNLWVVGGGDLAGQFADAGLLDELIVAIAPVTLGAGKPLLPRHVELRLDGVGRNGEFVMARFGVVRPA